MVNIYMKNDIYIIGSGGFAKEVTFLIEEINKVNNDEWNISGYIDEESKRGFVNGKYAVTLTDEEIVESKKTTFVANGIGNPKKKKKIINKLKLNENMVFPNLIHPSFIGDLDKISFGEGNIITANNIFTTDIKIGSFNIFNLSCTLGHDATIGDFNVFNPTVNLSGGIKVSNTNLIGTGVQILQYIEFLADEIIIGAGAVVSKSIREPGTYVGIPAKKLEKK